MNEIINLLENVVLRAWREEKMFSKSVLGKKMKRTDSVCQGISRSIYHKIFSVFPNSFMANFKVGKREHIVVYIASGLNNYIIDGTIQQFINGEKRSVFLKKEYPFKKELQTAERWNS